MVSLEVRRLKNIIYQLYIVIKEIHSEDLKSRLIFKKIGIWFTISKEENTVANCIKTSLKRREEILMEIKVILFILIQNLDFN